MLYAMPLADLIQTCHSSCACEGLQHVFQTHGELCSLLVAEVAAGDMVIFTQTLLHAGTEPKSNEKFVSQLHLLG